MKIHARKSIYIILFTPQWFSHDEFPTHFLNIRQIQICSGYILCAENTKVCLTSNLLRLSWSVTRCSLSNKIASYEVSFINDNSQTFVLENHRVTWNVWCSENSYENIIITIPEGKVESSNNQKRTNQFTFFELNIELAKL